MASEHNGTLLENIIGSKQSLKNINSNHTFNNISLEEYIAAFVYNQFRFYGYLTVNGFGILTNLLVISTVLTSNKLRKTSTGVLIMVLAHVEMLVCASGMVVVCMFYIENIGIKPHCLIIIYIWNIAKFYSHWIMVVIGVNRYAMVCRPFKHKKVTSYKSTLRQLAVLLLLCALAALFTIFGYDNERNDCILRKNDNLWMYYISKIVLNYIFSSILPIVTTTVLTILVFRKVRNNNVAPRTHAARNAGSHKRLEKQVTKALMASTVAFVLLCFPTYIVYVPYFLGEWQKPFSVPVASNLLTSVLILKVVESTNNSINFFLYCWYFPTFRQAVVRLFRCGHV